MKKTLSLLCFLIIASFGVAINDVSAQAVNADSAYKAIVKINTFILGPDYFLTHEQSGTGVIIASDGIILTNSHVVTAEYDFDGTERSTGFQVCLTETTAAEPDCSYSARLIAKNVGSDLALLQLEPISGLSTQTSFPYIELINDNSTAVNDDVRALGYPSIGGDTISITRGIISGEQNKYGNSWLKTDAVTSFGSSGGAVINDDGKLVGVPTQVHSDFAGSLGYAINIYSVYSWITDSMSGYPLQSGLQQRTIDLTNKQKTQNASDTFRHSILDFSITKPSGWDFTYSDEDRLFIDLPSDDDGGFVAVALIRFFDDMDLSMIDAQVKQRIADNLELGIVDITKSQTVNLGSTQARLIELSGLGSSFKQYYIPVGNYLIQVLYDYGTNEKDEDKVNSVLNSIVINSVPSADEMSTYANASPVFSVRTNDDWFIQPANVKEAPVSLLHKKNSARIAVAIEKKTPDTRDLSNDEYLQLTTDTVSDLNLVLQDFNLYSDQMTTDAHVKINDTLTDVIQIESKTKRGDTDAVVAQQFGYIVPTSDTYIALSMQYYGTDAAEYAANVTSFKNIMNSFTLTSQPGMTGTATTQTSSGESNESKSETQTVSETKTETKTSAVSTPSSGTLAQRLKGKILLQVESRGEAWYVHPDNANRFYMKDGDTAYEMMRSFGLGISDADLAKIPVGFEDRFEDTDSDGDGLADQLEDAIGTDKEVSDSDGDGYSDGEEVRNRYNPLGASTQAFDNQLAERLKGYIVLQVESRGEAWYINPEDGKRYYMKNGDAAYRIMRYLSLGITNANLAQIAEGTL